MILLVGSEGGMGTRYKRILEYLGRPYSCYDKKLSTPLDEAAKGCDRAIIATPTSLHAESIMDILSVMPSKPILCEKPIDKDLKVLKDILKRCKDVQTDLRMVFQYKRIYNNDGLVGPSHYDYFRHGDDGLAWDCIQIIGLAKTTVSLQEKSPFWSCAINGQRLHIQNMDFAYVAYIQDWLTLPSLCIGPDEILEIHEKVHEYIKAARYFNGST
jgi:hypothetical protein